MKSRLACLLCVATLLTGCNTWNVLKVRSQSPDDAVAGSAVSTGSSKKSVLVADLAVPFGMYPIQIEAIGMVTGLKGTGSDPAPSPQRAKLLAEMQTLDVKDPNTILASSSTALVLVRGVLRPGIQAGDRFDIEVQVPGRSNTESIRGGHLLETRLSELAVLGGRFREGHLLAIGQGAILVDPSAKIEKDRVVLGRGRVLGGGVALKSRPLALVLKPKHQNVFNSARLAKAVNRRFHTFNRGIKIGVAKAIDDKYIELIIHPRYKDNIARYVEVVRAVSLLEPARKRQIRLDDLRLRLNVSATAAKAAMELEAIGTDGIDILKEAIDSPQTEVCFYAAEALAYLDQREAAEPLAKVARREPAFRVFALTALSSMKDYAAYDQLREMLSLPSAETRYGAFRAMTAMNRGDALVRGEWLGKKFSYHTLDTTGPMMIHVTRSRRPEIVLFGRDQKFQTPLAIEAGNQILVTSSGHDEIAVAKFCPNEADQRRIVSTQVNDVIRAIVELGGTYPDVVQALQEAKATDALASRFEVDALPTGGRVFQRMPVGDLAETSSDKEEANAAAPSSPMPELFERRTGPQSPRSNAKDDAEDAVGVIALDEIVFDEIEEDELQDRPGAVGRFFARMAGRDPDEKTRQ